MILLAIEVGDSFRALIEAYFARALKIRRLPEL
jgi:hypothetical protein